MALPFFMVPVLVWFSRKLLVYLFSKRTERNNDKLEDLKVSKRKILEEVMETETYKNAKLILERFDPEAKKKAELESTPVRLQMTPRPGQEIRQRGVAMRPMPMVGPAGMVMMTPPLGERPPMAPGATPMAPGGPPERSALSTHVHQGAIHRTPCSPIPGEGMHPPGPPLARPVLPRERGTVDRVIEYLVGDGPQNRYALICQQCFSHNGMALKEEFEYIDEREVGEEEESGRQVVENSQSEESLQQKGEEEEEQQRAEEPMEEAGSEEAPSEGQEAEVQASDLQDSF
uniref:Endoplasmic reticulum junction formation protein lunapark n=1 Tax=Gadus morhua TaxID=8049 RepID=A0A8C5FUN7_GADMO